ncbi:MAG: hypothetical protein Q9182_007070 [Xanthomendoza sp. 2 TL-2023]
MATSQDMEALLERIRRFELQQEQSNRQVEQSNRQAEQSKLEAEQSKRQAEQSNRQAEQSNRQAEQSKLEAEQSKLEAEQSKLEAEQSKRQAEQSMRQADQSMRQAEQSKLEAEQSKRQVEQSNRQLQPSTLNELLTACYYEVDTQFSVEPDPTKCTKGTVTNPAGRLCPYRLRLWHDFPGLQEAAYKEICDFFHPPNAEPRRDFSPASSIADQGKRWGDRQIASEADLKDWQKSRVETDVQQVFRTFKGFGRFHNYAHVLGRDSDGRAKEPAHADQIFVQENNDGTTKLLVVIEYKPPHKLTVEHLRASIQSTADIDVERVRNINVQTYKDNTDTFFAKAQYLLAATTCQTYNYMIDSGCLYGCIMTGEAILFLHLDAETPTDLQYFLAEPRFDAWNEANNGLTISKTSVAQLTSFCIMAQPAKYLSQDWIRQAKAQATTWIIDLQDVIYNTPKKLREMEAKMDKLDLTYKGHGGPKIQRSPIQTRARKARSATACASGSLDSRDRYKDAEDSEDDNYYPSSPSKPATIGGRHPHQKGPSQGGGSSEKSTSMSQHPGSKRQYCTQACLLSLVHQLPIDQACPNAKSHLPSIKANTHALTRPKLARLIQQQLFRTMDYGCEDLRLQGSRGRLFRLTLDPHGYTFVAKGTVDLYTEDLKREGRMYRHLHQFQGHLIPVYLGNIDLSIPWYGMGFQIVHMLLLAHGGQELPAELDHEQDLQAKGFQQALAAKGVRHGDLRFPNMLWNQELQRVMFIDFERSRRVPVVAAARGEASRSGQMKTAPKKRQPLGNVEPSHATLNAHSSRPADGKLGALLIQPVLTPNPLASPSSKNQTGIGAENSLLQILPYADEMEIT